jgi:hypothetical protein
MLRPEDYAAMYEALAARGLHLINTPDEYRHCHYLPESYLTIAGITPVTVWLPARPAESVDFDSVMALISKLGDGPVVLKDYVKSQKHYWSEACYIPDPTDRTHVEQVVRRFLELQGDDLSGGLVFRTFVPLKTISRHPESGMPLSEEYRVFFLDGSPLYVVEYWEHGKYPGGNPPLLDFTEVAKRVRSQFFTMDLAQCADGTWMIVELGDAQVAGLPERTNIQDFYHLLAGHF